MFAEWMNLCLAGYPLDSPTHFQGGSLVFVLLNPELHKGITLGEESRQRRQGRVPGLKHPGLGRTQVHSFHKQ